MKKIFYLVACAALVLAGCNKEPKKEQVVLEEPAAKPYHISLTLEDEAFKPAIVEGSVPKTIDVTSGSTFVLGFQDNEAENPESAPLRFVSGNCIISKAPSAGLEFTFPRYGTLVINSGAGKNWNIKYRTPKNTDFSGSAILVEDKVTGTLANNICRSWKPTNIIVSATGGDLKEPIAGKQFSPDLSEAFDFLKRQGIAVDPDKYAQYQLVSLDFTESGKMFINFKDFAIAPFAGNFTLDESKDQNLTYDFNLAWVNNPLIPISGQGAINVTENNLTLNTESDVTLKGKTYHVIVTIICVENK